MAYDLNIQLLIWQAIGLEKPQKDICELDLSRERQPRCLVA